jgi:hypothetical protein
VTSFLFRTHPASNLYAGPIIFDLADAAAVMRWYREFQGTAPDPFYVFLGLQTVPPGDPFPCEHWNKRMCVLLVAHNGENAEVEVNALRRALPKPLIDWAGPMAYPAPQSMFDALNPPGMQWYWKGDFVASLPDTAIEAHIAHAAKAPSYFSLMHLYPIDGAVQQAKGSTAWSAHDATYSMVIAGIDPDPAKAQQLKEWATAYWKAVHPYDLAGAYPNFMMADEGEDRIKASFGDNYPRLRVLKAKYDPANLFRVNQNIARQSENASSVRPGNRGLGLQHSVLRPQHGRVGTSPGESGLTRSLNTAAKARSSARFRPTANGNEGPLGGRYCVFANPSRNNRYGAKRPATSPLFLPRERRRAIAFDRLAGKGPLHEGRRIRRRTIHGR